MDNLLYSLSVQKKRFKRIAKSAFLIVALLVLLIPLTSIKPSAGPLDSPLPKDEAPLKNTYEVFGFIPYWNLDKTDNVDFTVLTTLAYFGLPINSDGSIDTSDIGYQRFDSPQANELFTRAQGKGTRVVATITQLDNPTILAFLDNKSGQDRAIESIVNIVKERELDGVNIDFEYFGNPGDSYRYKFSDFVKRLSDRMHGALPNSQVTVSVYASAAKDPKMYDIESLAKSTDGIFMMAYDFATAGSDNVIPTAPLYGHKEGKYWYDISTAVDDFLKVMPKEKLILGLPWYGYDYPVSNPEVKAVKDTGYYSYYWYRGRRYSQFIARAGAHASTYSNVMASSHQLEGWDDLGKVGWRAYQSGDGWRMLFLDDTRSLSVKYDFAKEKGLAGVGMWALGFDHGNSDMWELLNLKFGTKLVDARSGPSSIRL